MRKSIESNIQPSIAATSARRWLALSDRNHGSLRATGGGASIESPGVTATHDGTGRWSRTQMSRPLPGRNSLVRHRLPAGARLCGRDSHCGFLL